MAFIQASLQFPEYFISTRVQLYFPTDLPPEVGNEVRGVITLLHGLGNSSSEWFHYSAACRYAADNGFVLVVPEVGNSFCNNMRYGAPWHTILTQLLPAQLRKIFQLPIQREQNFVAGLSMGGYGAFLLALSRPDLYAAAGSFSAPLDVTGMAPYPKADHLTPFLTPVFGEDLLLPPEANLNQLAQSVAVLPSKEQPRLYATCGKEDDTHGISESNCRFKALADKLHLDFTFDEWHGTHEWNYWDRSLAQFIGFILNNNYGTKKRDDWSTPGLFE